MPFGDRSKGAEESYLEIFLVCLLEVSPPSANGTQIHERPHLVHSSVSTAQNGAQHVAGTQGLFGDIEVSLGKVPVLIVAAVFIGRARESC